MESIDSFSTGALRTLKRIAPRDIGLARIGIAFCAAFEGSLARAHLPPEPSQRTSA